MWEVGSGMSDVEAGTRASVSGFAPILAGTNHIQLTSPQALTADPPSKTGPKLSKTLEISQKLSKTLCVFSKTLQFSRPLSRGGANRHQVHTPQALTAKNTPQKSRKKSQKVDGTQRNSQKLLSNSSEPMANLTEPRRTSRNLGSSRGGAERAGRAVGVPPVHLDQASKRIVGIPEVLLVVDQVPVGVVEGGDGDREAGPLLGRGAGGLVGLVEAALDLQVIGARVGAVAVGVEPVPPEVAAAVGDGRRRRGLAGVRQVPLLGRAFSATPWAPSVAPTNQQRSDRENHLFTGRYRDI